MDIYICLKPLVIISIVAIIATIIHSSYQHQYQCYLHWYYHYCSSWFYHLYYHHCYHLP